MAVLRTYVVRTLRVTMDLYRIYKRLPKHYYCYLVLCRVGLTDLQHAHESYVVP